MAGSVLTLSPRMPLDRAEYVVRSRVEREDIAEVVVTTTDRRQVAHLRRLALRLADADSLDCHGLTPRPDGTTHLIVYAESSRERRRGVGVWGEPKTG